MITSEEMLLNLKKILAEPAAGAPIEQLAILADPKIEKKIFHLVGKAIADFSLIENSDRIMVGVSGGKDSWALLYILNELKKRAPVDFSLVAVNIDQGYPGFRQDQIEDFVEQMGISFHMENFNIAGILEEKFEGDLPCSFCSRLRRGALYGLAEKLGCNKIALGHHRDDFIETLLLNQFFIGRLASMSPKLKAEDGKNVVIRPLVYVGEEMISSFAKSKAFPSVACQCPLMCGEVVHGDFKRKMVKDMLRILEQRFPEIKNSILASLTRVKPTHLLDRELWKFE